MQVVAEKIAPSDELFDFRLKWIQLVRGCTFSRCNLDFILGVDSNNWIDVGGA